MILCPGHQRVSSSSLAASSLGLSHRASIYLELAEVNLLLNRSEEAAKVIKDAVKEFLGTSEEIRSVCNHSCTVYMSLHQYACTYHSLHAHVRTDHAIHNILYITLYVRMHSIHTVCLHSLESVVGHFILTYVYAYINWLIISR